MTLLSLHSHNTLLCFNYTPFKTRNKKATTSFKELVAYISKGVASIR